MPGQTQSPRHPPRPPARDGETARPRTRSDSLRSRQAAPPSSPVTPAGRDDLPAPPAGLEVPGYVIEARIGQGGMGEVFLARQVLTGARRVIKVIRYDSLDLESIERFRVEVAALGSVQDPGVVTVHEGGIVGEQPYLVMEYVEGGELREQMTAPWEPERAARVCARILRGLAAVHAAGVIHRDLKPANIFLCDEDSPKIADFGLARIAGGEALTRTGDVLGTPAYMSPEQAMGLQEAIGPATDIWAVALILFQLLSGRLPYEQRNAYAILSELGLGSYRRIGSLLPELDPDLEAIVDRGMAREPKDRYASALEMAEDLEDWLRGEAPRALARSEQRRRWTISGGLGLIIAVILIGGLAVGGLVELARRRARDLQRAEDQARSALRELDAATREAAAPLLLDDAPACARRRERDLAAYREVAARLAELTEHPLTGELSAEAVGAQEPAAELLRRARTGAEAAAQLLSGEGAEAEELPALAAPRLLALAARAAADPTRRAELAREALRAWSRAPEVEGLELAAREAAHELAALILEAAPLSELEDGAAAWLILLNPGGLADTSDPGRFERILARARLLASLPSWGGGPRPASRLRAAIYEALEAGASERARRAAASDAPTASGFDEWLSESLVTLDTEPPPGAALPALRAAAESAFVGRITRQVEALRGRWREVWETFDSAGARRRLHWTLDVRPDDGERVEALVRELRIASHLLSPEAWRAAMAPALAPIAEDEAWMLTRWRNAAATRDLLTELVALDLHGTRGLEDLRWRIAELDALSPGAPREALERAARELDEAILATRQRLLDADWVQRKLLEGTRRGGGIGPPRLPKQLGARIASRLTRQAELALILRCRLGLAPDDARGLVREFQGACDELRDLYLSYEALADAAPRVELRRLRLRLAAGASVDSVKAELQALLEANAERRISPEDLAPLQAELALPAVRASLGPRQLRQTVNHHYYMASLDYYRLRLHERDLLGDWAADSLPVAELLRRVGWEAQALKVEEELRALTEDAEVPWLENLREQLAPITSIPFPR